MVILDQVISALIGTLALIVGVRAIVTRQIEVGEKSRIMAPWLASCCGRLVSLLTAVFRFAGTSKLIRIS